MTHLSSPFSNVISCNGLENLLMLSTGFSALPQQAMSCCGNAFFANLSEKHKETNRLNMLKKKKKNTPAWSSGQYEVVH